ncbi:hypothetical protein E2C01_071197 [Portunus trituberculatus]|uniref:Uncharacterized protein n=1 Tax=Portunus trituberculatus TaxID=210409 RepID=A0A5B7I460_PORTR|nr:hypothetical protein [Portunus trituberculatus]
MAERPAYPWLSPPASRTSHKHEERSPTLSIGSSLTLGSTLSLPLCSERSGSSSRASSRASSSSSSSWSSQWSWSTLLSTASFTDALVPPDACFLPCSFAHARAKIFFLFLLHVPRMPFFQYPNTFSTASSLSYSSTPLPLRCYLPTLHLSPAFHLSSSIHAASTPPARHMHLFPA